MQIRDRIKELRRVPASQLRPNPRNWRRHGEKQQNALRGVLAEVGYADALLARQLEDGSLELIDGHLRAETTPESVVPVLVLDVTRAEAEKILATHDPLAAMAETDAAQLESLLAEIDTDSPALREMLDGLLSRSAGDGEEKGSPAEEIDIPAAFQIVVECHDEEQQQGLYERLSAEGFSCRVVTLMTE